MIQSRKSRSRHAASWVIAIVGILGIVVIAVATLRAVSVQEKLDQRISTLQAELATWRYFTMRSQELAAKQALVGPKVGDQATPAAQDDLAPCLAAAAVIPPLPPGLEWNPLKARRAIRERQAWCTSAQQVIASAHECASKGALEAAVESLDRELAQRAPR